MENKFIYFADIDGSYIYTIDAIKTIQHPNDAANCLFMEMEGGVVQTYNYASFEDAQNAMEHIWSQIHSN